MTRPLPAGAPGPAPSRTWGDLLPRDDLGGPGPGQSPRPLRGAEEPLSSEKSRSHLFPGSLLGAPPRWARGHWGTGRFTMRAGPVALIHQPLAQRRPGAEGTDGQPGNSCKATSGPSPGTAAVQMDRSIFRAWSMCKGGKAPPAGAAGAVPASAAGGDCWPSRGLRSPESGSQDRGRRARDQLRPDGEGPSQESAWKAGPCHVPLPPRPAGQAPGWLCQAGSGCRRAGVLGAWASAAGRTSQAEPSNLPLWTGLPAMVSVQPWAGG